MKECIEYERESVVDQQLLQAIKDARDHQKNRVSEYKGEVKRIENAIQKLETDELRLVAESK